MKLFITGATGFVGSHFTAAALAAGHHCVACRRDPARPSRIPIEPSPTWVNKPLANLAVSDFRGIDCVVHLAAHSANPPYDSIEACLRGNVTEPLAMVRRAIEAGVRKFVIAGSCFEYGPAGERFEYIPTNAPLEATLSYPLSKAIASRVFAALSAETDVALSIHRIFHVFGPGEPESRLWPSLKAAAQRGHDFDATWGEQVRDFVHVCDVADQLVQAVDNMELQPSGPAAFHHIGTGQPQSIRQFSEYWWNRWGATGQIRFGAVNYRVGEVMRYVPQLDSGFGERSPNAAAPGV